MDDGPGRPDPPETLADALGEVRALLADGAADATALVRAVAAGRRRGSQAPPRTELRPVRLGAGPRLQVVERTDPGPLTRNIDATALPAVLDELLARPYGSWHVETAAVTLQLRTTRKGRPLLHRAAAGRPDAAVGAGGPVGKDAAQRAHDRVKQRLVDPDDPLFRVLGADAGKRRQVDAFLRVLEPVVRDLPGSPLRVVDLGCGNAYLTLAAHRFLAGRPAGVRTVGVELRPDLVDRSARRAREAGLSGLSFVAGAIAEADPGLDGVDVALALHACDTATDEALARAVRWRAPVVLAAPCCHHDLQRQLAAPPHPWGAVARHAILRERLADVLTDALRALVLRLLGYRVDVVEFVDSRHTARNALLRAVRTGAPPSAGAVREYADLTDAWQVRPALARMLAPEVDAAMARAR